MKSTPSELISTFRKKIYFTTAIGIILSILGIVVLFFIEWPGLGKNRYSLTGIFVIVIIYLWRRMITYQEILEGTPEDVIIKLEELLDEEDQRSKKYYWLKFFLLSFVALGWILNLVTETKKYLTFLLFTLFVAGVLFVILGKWLRLTAGFMLQDIKHSLREHHSEAS